MLGLGPGQEPVCTSTFQEIQSRKLGESQKDAAACVGNQELVQLDAGPALGAAFAKMVKPQVKKYWH